MSDLHGLPENIRQKFPHLQPVKRAPTLFSLNGCGVSMFGQRDFDADTQTYIKTYCISLVFLPIFALRAYRVADAGSRTWFFFAREPLSAFARAWNALFAVLVLFGGLAMGWNIHTSSPEYRAEQELKRAAELMQAGDTIKAAGIYRRQLDGPYVYRSRDGLSNALTASLQSDKTKVVATALHMIVALPKNVNQPQPLIPNVFSNGLALVTKLRPQDPEGALEIFTEITPLQPKGDSLKPLHIDLLKESIAAKPGNTNRIVELALLYEADLKLDEAVKVLQPWEKQLGDTEGARILGQYLLGEGKHEQAYGLLFPFVQTRLKELRRIESAYTNVVASVSKRVLNDLRYNSADRDFYDKYEKASKAEKEELVDEYIQSQMQKDRSYLRVLEQFKEANAIVHVALDLGLVQLNRAQGFTDAAARKAELEAAEKTFLAVRGFAGETDEYRMFLGQVYYWLGKSTEGRALFDQLLASQKRAFPILMSLAQTLRLVGEYGDARALAEEAYTTGKDKEHKFAAARLRALTLKDLDDQIAWLEKADTEDSYTQIELNGARGQKALQQGNKAQAAKYLQAAASGYEKAPKSASTLNNCALAYFDLYEATGNPETYKHGTQLMEEAVRLDPGNSILLNNALHRLISSAVVDVVHDALHLDALGEDPGLQLLSYLYANDAERAAVYQKLRANENMKRGLTYLDKALLLAPKNRGLYSTGLALQGSFRDLAELQKLQQRFHVAAPSFKEARENTLGAYSATNNAHDLEIVQGRIKQLEQALAEPAVRDHVLTYEHVMVSLIGRQLESWGYGASVDGTKLLATAKATYEKHQSTASRATLEAAYFFRASEEIAKQDANFAALLQKTRRSLAQRHLITFTLMRGGPLADLFRKNENFRQGMGLVEKTLNDFPSWVSIEEWAILSAVSPERSAALADRYKQNGAGRLVDDLQFEFNPLNASAVIEQYWVQKLLGDEKRATEIYQSAVKEGVPLPAL